jgi:hypothetical protein
MNMTIVIKNICAVLNPLLFLFVWSCDLFRPIGFPPRPVPPDMPAGVVMRGQTETFNARYLFALRDGGLWIKQFNTAYGEVSSWTCIGTTDNPYKTLTGYFYLGWVDDVSVDGGYIVLKSQNKVYWTLDGVKGIKDIAWSDRWGFPFGVGYGITFPSRYTAWSNSFSDANYQKYYTDGNNIKFTIFVGHLFLLDENQTDIHFADGWLPRDWGYQVGGPERGRFKAINISASGSVIFLIGRYGDMFTRHTDFDLIGANPFLKYTYETITIPDYSKIYNFEYPRRLPHADWVRQTKITGLITSRISISSNGDGQDARVLRVQGMNGSSQTGYFEKALTAPSWTFVETNETIPPTDYIDNQTDDTSLLDPGPSKEYNYSGELSGNIPVRLTGFKFYSSPATIDFQSATGDTVSLTLHHHIYFRSNVQYNIGSPGSPLVLKGVIQIPANPDDLRFLGLLYGLYLATISQNADAHFIPINIDVTWSSVRITCSLYPSFELVLSRL